MATSSRQSALFGVNDWRQIYNTFSSADFQSYDFETLRRSFINYLQIYYPETFNDYVESSEFVALLDVMAFMGQALAFRNDLNTRENFIDTAERRDSVIKLANLVNYNPKRNITGQGWLKLQSISTTENINDINGLNLANSTIIWNDPANIYWQEQMNTVINAALLDSQRIGRPGNTQTILGVRTDEYTINLPTGTLPAFDFQSIINSISMRFELVSVTSKNSNSIYEVAPRPTSRFNMTYRNDNLGFASINTGFFFYFKQGTLTPVDFSFNQSIKNQVQDLEISGVNNTDTWLWQLDNNGIATTEWQLTDNLYANSNSSSDNKRLFKVLSRTNDQVSYAFGDGVFADIPVGRFRAFVRGGNSLAYTINPADMNSVTISIPYVSRSNRTETLSLVLALQAPVNTAQTRESLAAIKLNAPSQFYAQNRMVNGEDYTVVPYTLYNSIIKSTAINRTSVGVSRNLDLIDPTGTYSSTDSFAIDGALYQDTDDNSANFTALDASEASVFLSNTLVDLIADYPTQQYYAAYWPRYSGYFEGTSIDHSVYWNQSTVNAGQSTGYFYIRNLDEQENEVNEPVALGLFSTENLKYVTAGATIKFVPPAGMYYFDKNNRLRSGIPNSAIGDKTYFWASVLTVKGDGYNAGEGNNADNTGPVVLNVFVPSGARISNYKATPLDNNFRGQQRLNYAIIPAFLNRLPNSIVSEITTRILLNNTFSLTYDNSKLINENRWAISDLVTPPENTVVRFLSQGSSRYVVTVKSLSYYFGSVSQTRFLYQGDQLVYDSKTGKLLKDFVAILGTNTLPNSVEPVSQDQRLNIIGQSISTLGVPNDFEVQVSPPDANLDNIIDNPDFFSEVTGYNYTYGTDNSEYTVFFRQVIDSNNLVTTELIPEGEIVTDFSTLEEINNSLTQYNIGTVFYASLPLNLSDISDITTDSSAILTTTQIYNFYDGQSVTIQGVVGMTQVNNQNYYVKTTGAVITSGGTVNLNATKMALYTDAGLTTPLDTRTFGIYQSGGTVESRSYPIILARQTSPAQISLATSHNYRNGDPVVIQNINGTTQLNNRPLYAQLVSDTTLNLYKDENLIIPLDGTDFSAYVNGGTVAVRSQTGAFYQSSRVAGSYTNQLESVPVTSQYSVLAGRGNLQYQYRHNSPNTFRIDPGTTNIIDLYLVTQSYYTAYRNWINDSTGTIQKPLPPTIDLLEQEYNNINEFKMISDSVVFNSVVFKPLFGSKAAAPFRANLKVVKSIQTTVSDSDIKTIIVNAMNSYFDIANWGFGDTFFFSELSAYLHQNVGDLISSVVLVPADPNVPFGTLYEIHSAPYEIFVNGATTNDIVVISALTPAELQF